MLLHFIFIEVLAIGTAGLSNWPKVTQGHTSPDLPVPRALCFLQPGDNPGFALLGKRALSTEFKGYFTGKSIP